VECVPCAVGATAGAAEFFHVPDGIPSSSSLSREFMQGSGAVSSQVRVIRLDDFLREKGVDRVDLVKIDTESTEPEVLAGFAETLDRCRPTIVCEVLPGRGSAQLLADFLGPRGYHFYLLTPDGPLARTEIKGHHEWLNYLFSPLGPAEVQQW
jgi:hypothetical protein